jgi:2-oxoisovalerate dehydrogenase E1 component
MKIDRKNIQKFYEESLKIRFFENSLLDLFSKGLVKGTTHTSIGQENNAVGVCAALKSKDVVLSNHRCHGHFLAHTKNYGGLLNEILGKKTGVCGGIGGSQHLFYKKIFYSNGILGGNLPMSVGLAKAKKIKKDKNIVCVFIGDGVLGEGVFYECLNIISIYNLPILIVIEDNEIAQTTNTKKTISGSIYNKCKSFNINTSELRYPDANEVFLKTKSIVKNVRKQKPHILILKSTRLGPHSKGDDTRSKEYLKKLIKIDPLKKLEKKYFNKKQIENSNFKAKQFVEHLFKKNLNSKFEDHKNTINDVISSTNISFEYLNSFKGKRFGELINHYLLNLVRNDKKVIIYGEDVVDPYGGAFKITKNIESNFPKQIFSTPISEASIVGMAAGFAIEGYKPIVEIMFGDFLGLAFDQILNNLSKFHYMYNNEVNLPLVIRTPMGAGRGYGPTHSQSIEKHFFGIIGLNIFAVNPFFPIDKIYDYAFRNKKPSLLIENKLQYGFIISDIKNSHIKNFKNKISSENFLSSFSLSNFENDDLTILCYGSTSELAIKSAYDLFIENELNIRVVVFSKLSDLDELVIKNILADKGPIITLEESSKNFGFGSEIAAILNEDSELKKRKFLRISSQNKIIPSSPILEKEMLISINTISANILKALNE